MAIKNIQKFIPDLIKIKATPQPFVSVLPSPISVIDRLLETEAIEFKSADKSKQSINSSFTLLCGLETTPSQSINFVDEIRLAPVVETTTKQ